MLSLIDGPIWNRYYNNCVVKGIDFKAQFDAVTSSFKKNGMDVERLVCAHTPVSDLRKETNDCMIKPEKHKNVWFIDVGMSEGFRAGNRWGGLELNTLNGNTLESIKSPVCWSLFK